MASKKEELAAKAARVQRRPNESGERDATALRSHHPTTPRTKPVRVTCDLAPLLHRELRSFAAQTAEALNQPSVTNVRIIRALIERLMWDTNLQEGLLDDLRHQDTIQ